MELHASTPVYNDAWARRVHAALVKLYGDDILEYGEWMLKPFRTIASGEVPQDVRRSTAEEFRHKLGIAASERLYASAGSMGTGRSETEFLDVLSTLLFLHALPITADSAGVRFPVKAYIDLQERFGDEDVLCGKLRGLGIDPAHVMPQRDMFVMAKEEGERLQGFLKGETSLLPSPMRDVPTRRYDLITANDVQMQRYHEVLPHAIARMEQYLKSQYSRLYRFCPYMLEHIVMSDATPVEDGFARPDQKLEWQQEHNNRELFSVLKEYNGRNNYYAYAPTQADLHQRATNDLERLKSTFQRQVRAHMMLNQLEFQAHETVQDVPETRKRPVVWSISSHVLEPLMQYARADSPRLFFLSAGAGDCGEAYTGHADERNGITSRFVVTDNFAMDYLRDMGAKVVPTRKVVQIASECVLQRKEMPRVNTAPASEATLLPMESWARKLQDRKARPAPNEPAK